MENECGQVARDTFLFDDSGKTTHASRKEIREMLSSRGEACGVISSSQSGEQMFCGILCSACEKKCTDDPGILFWYVRRGGEGKLGLEVEVNMQAPALALGPLLAMCLETPEGLPPSSRQPFLMRVFVRGESRGAAGLREAEYWLAPLSSLAKHVTVEWKFGRLLWGPHAQWNLREMLPRFDRRNWGRLLHAVATHAWAGARKGEEMHRE